MEERFVLGEITKEPFDKYATKYKNDLENLVQQINQIQKSSFTLGKAIEKSLEYAENIVQVWVSYNYINKQQLQYRLFPEGVLYDKEVGIVRTSRINTLFTQIALLLAKVLEEKKRQFE
jgi:hypothetical protein